MKRLMFSLLEKFKHRKLLCIFIFAFSVSGAIAQPGYSFVGIPNSQELEDLYNRDPSSFLLKIDSNTKLSDLKYLAKRHYIHLLVKTKILPQELNLLSDSLRHISIDGANQLLDMSALTQLKNLESISIGDYAGEILPDLSVLTKLRSFVVISTNGRDKLESISGLNNCKALKILEIRSNSLAHFNMDIGKMNIEDLTISNCPALKNIDEIANSKTVKKLSLEQLRLRSLPEKMSDMENLKNLDLVSMPKLKSIENLRQMKNLRTLYISGVPELVRIPKSLHTNPRIDTLIFRNLDNLQSGEGIDNLSNLSFLSIEDICEDFVIPSNISSCINLESICFSTNFRRLNRVRDISMIKNLKKLKKLSLEGLPFTVLPNEIYTNINLEDLTFNLNNAITDLTGIIRFKKLNKLEIGYNDKLKKIPALDQLLYINNVRITNNESLVITDNKPNKKEWDIEENGIIEW